MSINFNWILCMRLRLRLLLISFFFFWVILDMVLIIFFFFGRSDLFKKERGRFVDELRSLVYYIVEKLKILLSEIDVLLCRVRVCIMNF